MAESSDFCLMLDTLGFTDSCEECSFTGGLWWARSRPGSQQRGALCLCMDLQLLLSERSLRQCVARHCRILERRACSASSPELREEAAALVRELQEIGVWTTEPTAAAQEACADNDGGECKKEPLGIFVERLVESEHQQKRRRGGGASSAAAA